MKSGMRRIQGFFQGVLLLLGLVVVSLVAAVTTMHFAIHGAEVRVPALKEMTVAEARSQTSGLGLNLEVDNRYYSADVAAGHILSQSPAPGAVVRREWRVRVAESLGPQKVEVPSVVNQPERSAALNLRRVGLEAGMTVRLPWAATGKGTEEGSVLAQDPPAKAQGIEKPSVNLLVAAPDDTSEDGYVMPELTGMPIVSAQALLTRVGIKFGEPKFQDVAIPAVTSAAPVGAFTAGGAPVAPAPMRPTALPGTVVSQSPPAGWRVGVGMTVALSVAK
jgi:eukaryotic-like serine/threonine-protein kinase